MKKLSLLMILLLVFFSCCNISRIEKRKYRPGFFVSLSTPSQQKVKVNNQPTTTLTGNNGHYSIIQPLPLTPGPDLACLDNVMNYPAPMVHQALPDAQTQAAGQDPAPGVHHQRIIALKEISGTPSVPDQSSPAVPGQSSLQKRPPQRADLPYLLFSGLLAAGALTLTYRKMRNHSKVSIWASKNPSKTKVLLGIAHFTSAGLGAFAGKELRDLGIHTSELSTMILLGLSAAVILLYPRKHERKGPFKSSYRKQGIFAVVLSILGFLLTLNIGNQAISDPFFTPGFYQSIYMPQETHTSTSSTTALTGDEMLAGNDLVKEGTGKGEKIVLTILSVLLFLVVLAGIALLTCSLVCNGQELLAALVALGGTALATYLLIVLIKAIWNQNIRDRKTIKERKLTTGP